MKSTRENLWTFVAFCFVLSCTTLANGKPNIVFFLVDDLGWGAMSACGHPVHETPHFDGLCKWGVRFTQAYSACTVCSPSRAAIMTGQYPARIHLTDWIAGHQQPNTILKIPDWSMRLSHDHTTLPEALQQHGYRTGFFGKWHLMPVREPDEMVNHTPERHGFDVNIGGREWGQPKGRGKYFYPFDMPGLDDGREGEYLTDRLTDEAVRFLDESAARGKPFFLYLSYYTVHTPIQGKPELSRYYHARMAEQEPDAVAEERAGAGKKRRERFAQYAAMHASLDESVGRILERLERLELTKETIVIFTGDNGGNYPQSCGGLRGFKGHAHEGGTRVPTCIVWPEKVLPGTVCDTPVIGTDFYPTILEMIGAEPMPSQHLDGLSLVSLMEAGEQLDRQDLFWHYPHYHRTKPYGAIRSKDWKLIEYFEDGELQLFDLASDPTEKVNLADSQPARAEELLGRLKAWRQSVNAQMPTLR